MGGYSTNHNWFVEYPLYYVGSLSIVGVGFVKIPPHLFNKGTFYVWFQVLLILVCRISLRITGYFILWCTVEYPGPEALEVPDSVTAPFYYLYLVIEAFCRTIYQPVFKCIWDFFPSGSVGPGTVYKLLNSAVQGIHNPVIEFPLLLTVGLHLADIIKPLFHAVCQTQIFTVRKH